MISFLYFANPGEQARELVGGHQFSCTDEEHEAISTQSMSRQNQLSFLIMFPLKKKVFVASDWSIIFASIYVYLCTTNYAVKSRTCHVTNNFHR